MWEVPITCLAEEIETHGEGQVRALITLATNPVLSSPNGARLARALDGLEFMVSMDIYLNETTRHADVILPGPSPLRIFTTTCSTRRYRQPRTPSAPVFARAAGQPAEWETFVASPPSRKGSQRLTMPAPSTSNFSPKMYGASLGTRRPPCCGPAQACTGRSDYWTWRCAMGRTSWIWPGEGGRGRPDPAP